jgi:hypothetical protein
MDTRTLFWRRLVSFIPSSELARRDTYGYFNGIDWTVITPAYACCQRFGHGPGMLVPGNRQQHPVKIPAYHRWFNRFLST